MAQNHETRRIVCLDLNEELQKFAENRLAQFRKEHPHCAENVLCDLPDLNRKLSGTVENHLNAIQYYGMKQKTAEICCISPKTLYNYEHYIPP